MAREKRLLGESVGAFTFVALFELAFLCSAGKLVALTPQEQPTIANSVKVLSADLDFGKPDLLKRIPVRFKMLNISPKPIYAMYYTCTAQYADGATRVAPQGIDFLANYVFDGRANPPADKRRPIFRVGEIHEGFTMVPNTAPLQDPRTKATTPVTQTETTAALVSASCAVNMVMFEDRTLASDSNADYANITLIGRKAELDIVSGLVDDLKQVANSDDPMKALETRNKEFQGRAQRLDMLVRPINGNKPRLQAIIADYEAYLAALQQQSSELKTLRQQQQPTIADSVKVSSADLDLAHPNSIQGIPVRFTVVNIAAQPIEALTYACTARYADVLASSSSPRGPSSSTSSQGVDFWSNTQWTEHSHFRPGETHQGSVMIPPNMTAPVSASCVVTSVIFADRTVASDSNPQEINLTLAVRKSNLGFHVALLDDLKYVAGSTDPIKALETCKQEILAKEASAPRPGSPEWLKARETGTPSNPVVEQVFIINGKATMPSTLRLQRLEGSVRSANGDKTRLDAIIAEQEAYVEVLKQHSTVKD